MYTYTVIHSTGGEPELPGFCDYPYGVAIVELDDSNGVRMASYVPAGEIPALHIGQRMHIDFLKLSDDISMPFFTAINESG